MDVALWATVPANVNYEVNSKLFFQEFPLELNSTPPRAVTSATGTKPTRIRFCSFGGNYNS